jgi:hypothetical protein
MHSLAKEWVSTTRRKMCVVDFGGNTDRRNSEGNKENHELRVNNVTEIVQDWHCHLLSDIPDTVFLLVILKQQIFRTKFKCSSETVLFRVTTNKLHFHSKVICLFFTQILSWKFLCCHYYLKFTDAEFRTRLRRNDVLRKNAHLNWTWFSTLIYVLIQLSNVQQQWARFLK